MGKRTKNRKQQLREIRERRQRYVPTLPQRPFSWGRFLAENQSEIFFIGILIIASVFVYSFAHSHSQNRSDVAALNSAVPQNQINDLRKRYPQGFRIFALSNQQIVALDTDTLPQGLKVDWDISHLVKLSRDEIRFQLGDISYRSKLLLSAFPVKMPRREGKTSNTMVVNNVEITVELLGEYTNGIFFALGFKES
jgi:hypothetical protein